jgi:hypothetical protein
LSGFAFKLCLQVLLFIGTAVLLEVSTSPLSGGQIQRATTWEGFKGKARMHTHMSNAQAVSLTKPSSANRMKALPLITLMRRTKQGFSSGCY